MQHMHITLYSLRVTFYIKNVDEGQKITVHPPITHINTDITIHISNIEQQQHLVERCSSKIMAIKEIVIFRNQESFESQSVMTTRHLTPCQAQSLPRVVYILSLWWLFISLGLRFTDGTCCLQQCH